MVERLVSNLSFASSERAVSQDVARLVPIRSMVDMTVLVFTAGETKCFRESSNITIGLGKK